MAELSPDTSPSPSGPDVGAEEPSLPAVQAVRRTSYMAKEQPVTEVIMGPHEKAMAEAKERARGSAGAEPRDSGRPDRCGGGEDGGLADFAPYIHTHPRRNSITPDRQRRFILRLAATGIVKQAAQHIGASVEALYVLRTQPGAEGFAEAWERAVDTGMQRMEDAALERATFGEERLVVSGGKVLGTERRFNESLVQFMLRNRRTERYTGMTGAIGKSHPIYKRIRQEVRRDFIREEKRKDGEVLERLTRKLQLMRERKLAAERLLAQDRDGSEDGA